MSLSVYFHPRIFWLNNITGISRYVCELANHLEDLGIDVHIPIRDTQNANFHQSPHANRWQHEADGLLPPGYETASKLIALCAGRYGEKIRRQKLRAEGLRYLAKRGKYDLVHPTHNNAIEILPKLDKATPLVITIHDMIHELHPHSFAPADTSALRKKLFAQRADRIIAISSKTKEDIVDILGVDPDRIDVVHHGNSLHLPPDYRERVVSLPGRYILFVGQRQGYKNFARFAKAAANLMKEDDSLHLVCIGAGFTQAEKNMLGGLGISRRTHCMRATDEELAIAYNRALAFVYPSEYEGFGLPLLEAFECKAPVLCSRASCFPEIAGNAARYFDPADTDEMQHAIASVVFDEAKRGELISCGRERIARFSWDKCARETLECYKRVLG